ncbi:hypothetical protein K474DRAFT_1674928 [Panus rudis PR-1116 ss-1]|nr:hypothetical protein K474DRAFT_1674928 [Panus rudis PR-1116 ss-1]
MTEGSRTDMTGAQQSTRRKSQGSKIASLASSRKRNRGHVLSLKDETITPKRISFATIRGVQLSPLRPPSPELLAALYPPLPRLLTHSVSPLSTFIHSPSQVNTPSTRLPRLRTPQLVPTPLSPLALDLRPAVSQSETGMSDALSAMVLRSGKVVQYRPPKASRLPYGSNHPFVDVPRPSEVGGAERPGAGDTNSKLSLSVLKGELAAINLSQPAGPSSSLENIPILSDMPSLGAQGPTCTASVSLREELRVPPKISFTPRAPLNRRVVSAPEFGSISLDPGASRSVDDHADIAEDIVKPRPSNRVEKQIRLPLDDKSPLPSHLASAEEDDAQQLSRVLPGKRLSSGRMLAIIPPLPDNFASDTRHFWLGWYLTDDLLQTRYREAVMNDWDFFAMPDPVQIRIELVEYLKNWTESNNIYMRKALLPWTKVAKTPRWKDRPRGSYVWIIAILSSAQHHLYWKIPDPVQYEFLKVWLGCEPTWFRDYYPKRMFHLLDNLRYKCQ